MMSPVYRRLNGWRKRIVLAAAALPLLQATGTCDPFALNSTLAGQFASATLGVFIGAVQQVLLQNFPSADVLQILLGGNRQPFFQS